MPGDSIECRMMERRRAPRRIPAADEPLSRVRLRLGNHLTVVDLSNCGALIEGPSRLLPGTHVEVHIVTADGRVLARSRVVRAYVHHLERDVIHYRGAISFDRPVDSRIFGYSLPAILAAPEPGEGSGYPDSTSTLAAVSAERLPA